MSAATTSVVALILNEERGIADLGDGKGLTIHGQTQEWLDEFGLPTPKNETDAAANYEVWLWQTRIAEVCEIDVGLGHFVADDALHSGLVQAIKDLQRALGGIDVDGIIGPETLGAVARAKPLETGVMLLADRCQEFGDLLASTVVDRRKWSRGWHNRLARQILRLPTLKSGGDP